MGFGGMRRGVAASAVVALGATVLVACQTGRVGRRCATTDFGQDRTHVLVCKQGRWRRLMTKEQAAQAIAAIARAKAAEEAAAASTTTTPPPPPTTAPPATTTTTVPGLPTVAADSVAAGGFHTCAALVDGTVLCWGSNLFGQLGFGSSATSRSTAVAVSGLTSAVEVAAGLFHSCARRSDGTVWCWGNGQAGQLGNGSTANRTTPVQVTGITTAVAITVSTRIDAAT